MNASCKAGGKLLLVVATAVAVTLTPFVEASADYVRLLDLPDTPGRLDIRNIRHGHGERPGVLFHRLGTHRRWARWRLGNQSVIYFWISTDADAYAERRIVVDFVSRRLRAQMERYDEFSDGAAISILANLRVTRPTRRSIKVFFPRRLLGKAVTEYGWSAETYYRARDSRRCRRRVCIDDAPVGSGRGRVVHRLG